MEIAMTPLRKYVEIFLLVVLGTFCAYYLYRIGKPRTLTVPSLKYSSIQSAIRAAKPGDNIFIKNGVYDGGINLKSGINVMGEDVNNVIIQKDAFARSVIFAKSAMM